MNGFKVKEIQSRVRVLDIIWTNHIDSPYNVTDKNALSRLHKEWDDDIEIEEK